MAQFAVHVASGIYSGNLSKKNAALQYALLVGNILPDLDFVPMLLVYPFNDQLALSLHRSFSHTMFLPLLIFITLFIISLIYDNKKYYWWGLGLAVGIVIHIILDVIFWFDQVLILWPLDIWGISTETDLWNWLGVIASTNLTLLLSPTLEFLFYGLLFFYLGRVVQNEDKTGSIKIFKTMFVLSLIIYSILVASIFILEPKLVVELSYGIGAIIWAPILLLTVWKYRDQILT